jgi:DNA ligase-1
MSDFKWRKPMKAEDFIEEELKFPYYASVKLDGYRAIVDQAVVRTSSGAPIGNDFVREILSQESLEGLDGELIVGAWNDKRAFRNTCGPVRKKSGHPNFRLFLFDDRTRPGDTFATRFSMLKHRVSVIQSRYKRPIEARIEVIPQTLVHNREELARFEEAAILAHFEGVMLTAPEGHYKFGRSTLNENLRLKVKRFVTEEAIIIGFEEQRRTVTEEDVMMGRNAPHEVGSMVPTGMIGAFKVHSGKWGAFDIQATSLSFEERVEAFQKFDSMYVGETASFEYFPHGTIDRPRHGIFRGIRGEEDMTE